MRKILATAALLAALPFAAQAAKDSVTIGMRGEPPGLDPTTGAAAAISEVTLYNVYETLTRLDNSGAVLPMLAKSWTVSPDGLVYTFKLLEGVKFHDGAAFDSSDVKFSFERNQGPKSQNKRKEVFDAMKAIETPDPLTVVVTLDAPKSLLAFELAQSTAVMVDPATAENNKTDPVGTGPYKFAKWVKGDSVTLEKFAGHRDAARLQIAKATFRFIGDATAQVTGLLAGDIDYLPILGAPELLSQFKDKGEFQVLEGTTEGEVILSTNNKRLTDVRMRRALAYAIDRKAVIEAAMFGHGQPIGSHFAPHHPAYVDLTGTYPYDPEKAKALLKEAGYDGRELQLRLPPFDYAQRSGEIIADMLQKAGMKVKIENLEWAQWLDQVYKNRQYDLTIVSHVEPMDMGIYAKSAADYYFQYESPAFQEIMKKADQAVSKEEQFKWLQAGQRHLAEDAVNGYLFQLAKLGVARKGLKGLWTNSPAFVHAVAEMRWE